MKPDDLLTVVLSIVGTLLAMQFWLLKIIFNVNKRLEEMELAINASGEKRKAEIREFVNDMLNASYLRITDRIEALDKTDHALANTVMAIKDDIADIRIQGKFYHIGGGHSAR